MADSDNRKHLAAGGIGLVGGLGGRIATMAGPQAYPAVPSIVWAAIMWVGVALFVGAVGYLIYEYAVRPRRAGKPRLDPLQIIGFIAALVLAGVFLLQLIRGPHSRPASLDAPAVLAVSPAPPAKTYSAYDRDQRQLFIDEYRKFLADKTLPILKEGRRLQQNWKERLLADRGAYMSEIAAYKARWENHVQELASFPTKIDKYEDLQKLTEINDYHALREGLHYYTVAIQRSGSITPNDLAFFMEKAVETLTHKLDDLARWYDSTDSQLLSLRKAT